MPQHAEYSKRCGNATCNGKAYFDGQSMGLLNMKSFCISYEVLRYHLHQFLNGRYYKLLTDERLSITLVICITGPQYLPSTLYHDDAGGSVPIPYNSYLKAWYGFVHLLDVPYEKGFTCGLVGYKININCFSRFNTSSQTLQK